MTKRRASRSEKRIVGQPRLAAAVAILALIAWSGVATAQAVQLTLAPPRMASAPAGARGDGSNAAPTPPAIAMITAYRAALCAWRTYPECSGQVDHTSAANGDLARLQFLAADRAIRLLLPEALDAIGEAATASSIRSLPPVHDVASAEGALRTVLPLQRDLMSHARELIATDQLPTEVQGASYAYTAYAAWDAAMVAWLAAAPNRSIGGASAVDIRNAVEARRDLFGHDFPVLGWTDTGALTTTQGINSALANHDPAHIQAAYFVVATAAYAIVAMSRAGRHQADFDRVNEHAHALLQDLVAAAERRGRALPRSGGVRR